MATPRLSTTVIQIHTPQSTRYKSRIVNPRFSISGGDPRRDQMIL
jgi:hypothetical protein